MRVIGFTEFQNIYESLKDEDVYFNTSGFTQKQTPKIKENVKKVLQELFLLEADKIDFIGTAGYKKNKTDLSYNLDVIIELNSLLEKNNITNEDTFSFLKSELKRFNFVTKMDESKKCLLVEWQTEDNKILVKLKPTKKFEFTKYFRTTLKESAFTNKYRETFLESIAVNLKKTIKEYFREDHPKSFLIKEFDCEDGLIEYEKSYIGRHGTLKKSRTIAETKNLISEEPKQILTVLFGDKKPNMKKYKMFEYCFEQFLSDKFPYSKKRGKILETFKEKLSKKNLEINEELKELFKKIK